MVLSGVSLLSATIYGSSPPLDRTNRSLPNAIDSSSQHRLEATLRKRPIVASGTA